MSVERERGGRENFHFQNEGHPVDATVSIQQQKNKLLKDFSTKSPKQEKKRNKIQNS